MNIYQKLSELRKEVGTLEKGSANPFFKSRYVSIDDLLDALQTPAEKLGLLILQPCEDGEVITEIINIEKPDEYVKSTLRLPDIADPQKMGSAITYYRRYTLLSLLALRTEDDDGNTASKSIEDVSQYLT